MSTKMNVKEFEGVLHTPRKLDQIIRDGKEIPQTLPPRSAMTAYPVDSYPACPDSWMNGSDIAGSYFVGVEEDKGMWLDFNPCCSLDKDVAIVISIQGVNPITGKKTDALRLEQYKSKCPIHDVPFQQDNYCPECEYDWPDQNYIATTGTPLGNFWLDGFRRPDGTVRQYIFTAEEMKGIASQIIGKDKVYAIGIAFYYSKDKKTTMPSMNSFRGGNSSAINYQYAPEITNLALGGDVTVSHSILNDCSLQVDGLDSCDLDITDNYGPSGASASASYELGSQTCGSLKGTKGMLRSKSIVQSQSACIEDNARSIIKPVKPTKKLEIGAGALINQKVYRDTKTIDYWEDEPAGMLYVNYCDMETLNNILEAGKIKKKSEGFMDGLTVGS